MKNLLIILLLSAYSTNNSNAQRTIYYVDSNISSSGDGLTWGSAIKTITEAVDKNLIPGDLVFIKPGIYPEQINFTKSGSEILPVTNGVSVNSENRINFPTGTDLSVIDLMTNPNQSYAYVYRSYNSNNGYFKIISVNDNEDYIIVENGKFINESGTVGDYDKLSCSIARPIIFKKYSSNPETERVEVNISSKPNAYTVMYIGTYINDYDAIPCNFMIIDGLDLTGSQIGGGLHIQDSKNNVFSNAKVYDLQASGILINGNSVEPANYNIIMNAQIFNTPYEGIYIGAGGNTENRNYTNYNHIIGCSIYTSGSSQNAKLENAIEIKEYNIGNVLESNYIHDFKLQTQGNGAINLKGLSKKSLVYNNVI